MGWLGVDAVVVVVVVAARMSGRSLMRSTAAFLAGSDSLWPTAMVVRVRSAISGTRLMRAASSVDSSGVRFGGCGWFCCGLFGVGFVVGVDERGRSFGLVWLCDAVV